MTEQQRAYWQKLLDGFSINEDDSEDAPTPKRYAIVYLDTSEGNGPFVKTFDTREELIEFDRSGQVYVDTATGGERWTRWEVFAIHDLYEMHPFWFRHVLDIGPASKGESDPPSWPLPVPTCG